MSRIRYIRISDDGVGVSEGIGSERDSCDGRGALEV